MKYPVIMFCEQDALEKKYFKAVQKLIACHKRYELAKKKELSRKNNNGPTGPIWKEYFASIKALEKYRKNFLKILQTVVYYQTHESEVTSNDD